MPYKILDPAPGRSPFYRVRGTEFGVYLDRSTSTSDRREAQKFLIAWRDEARRRAISGPLKAVPTFASAALAYMQADGEKRFLAPLLEHFGEMPLDQIGQAEIDAAAVALYPDSASATRNRQVYSPMSAILKRAGVDRALKRPKGWRSTPRLHWLQPEPAFALLASARAVDIRFGALCTFLLYCGCRLSEALRLDWADIDLSASRALLRQTKNGSPIPLHLPPIVIAELGNLPARAGRVFGSTKNGRLYARLADAEKRSGVMIPEGISFHIFRHSHATWRRRATGADTSALVGTGLWKSREAAGVYEHLDPSEEARKSDLLPTERRGKSVRSLGNGRKI